MNDQEQLVKKERNRYLILKSFYDKVDGDTKVSITRESLLQHFVEQEEMSRKEAELAFDYLLDKKLLETRAFGGVTSITSLGVKEIEDLIKNPKKDTEHFSAQAIQVDIVLGDKFAHIDNSTKISQIHSGSGDNVARDKNITNYNRTDLSEAVIEIQDLLDQLSKTYPDSSKLKIASLAEEEIKNNPNLKTKAIKSLKAGTLEALKTHPLGAFVIEAIKEFKSE